MKTCDRHNVILRNKGKVTKEKVSSWQKLIFDEYKWSLFLDCGDFEMKVNFTITISKKINISKSNKSY